MLRTFYLCAFSILLLQTAGSGNVRAQTLESGRRWWSPGQVTSLPGVDSLRSPTSQNLIAFDFQHALSLITWSSTLRLLSSAAFSNPLPIPQFIVNLDGRSRLREDTRIRTTEGNGLISADIPVHTSLLGITVSLLGTTYSLASTAGESLLRVGSPSTVTDGYAMIGGRYSPFTSLRIDLAGGIAHKSFEVGSGSGTIIRGTIINIPTSISEENSYDGSANIDERHFTLADETLRNDNIHGHLSSVFGDGSSNDASFGVSVQRRDFFFPKDTSGSLAKQERRELAFELHDALEYTIIPKKLVSNIRIDLSPHQITRRTPSIDLTSVSAGTLATSTFLVPSSTNALDVGFSGRLNLSLGSQETTDHLTRISAEMKYDERSETNDILQGETKSIPSLEVKKLSDALQAASFDGKQTSLQISGEFPVTLRDAIRVDASSRIYRYDTQSSDNHDDRDELGLSGTLDYSHVFSSSFILTNELRLAKIHLVYLESDRSLQNYVSKTIAFATQTIFHTSSIQHALRAEIFASYSVYDFLSHEGSRDYLIRGINGADSISVSIGSLPIFGHSSISIQGIFDLRLYERGAFNTAAFTERPVLRTSELSGEATLKLEDRGPSSPMLIRFGVRGFFLRRFSSGANSPTSDLNLLETLDRIGPLLVVTIDRAEKEGARLYGSIWYSIARQQAFDIASTHTFIQVEARLATQWSF